MKAKRKTRLLAVIVALVMAFAMMPLTVFAENDVWYSTLKLNARDCDMTLVYGSVEVDRAEFDFACGIQTTAINGYTAKITGGDISVNAPDASSQCGIEAFAGDYGMGNPTSGTIIITTGNIITGNNGVQIDASFNSSADVTVNGNIIAGVDNTDDASCGVEAYAMENSSTKVVVNGNVESTSLGIDVNSTDEAQATSTAGVEVYGDVTAKSGDGIRFIGKVQSNDVLVTGTVSYDVMYGYGVVSDLYKSYESNNNNNLTVWKIAAGNNSAPNMFVKKYSEEGNYQADPDTAKATNYIIKSGKGVTPRKADGSALDKSHDLPVAKEGEKVIVTATNGGTVTKAYNDGKEITDKDENGNFYVIVPRGGGVNLTADIKAPAKKAANPLTVKGKTAKVKRAKLKKKAQKLDVTKVISFTQDAKDKKAYALSSVKKGKKSFKKYVKIDKTTGQATIKKNKKMKKGTYKVKIKVQALGDSYYLPSSVKTVTAKIKVK